MSPQEASVIIDNATKNDGWIREHIRIIRSQINFVSAKMDPKTLGDTISLLLEIEGKLEPINKYILMLKSSTADRNKIIHEIKKKVAEIVKLIGRLDSVHRGKSSYRSIENLSLHSGQLADAAQTLQDYAIA